MANINGVAAGWNEHLSSLPGARKTKTYTEVTNDKFHPFVTQEGWTYDSAYDMVHRGADAGRGYMNAAIAAAGDALGAATQGAETMRGDAASMRQQANLVNSQADALAALVPQLDPYKGKLTNYGDDLDALSSAIQSRAGDVFGQGEALMTLDRGAGGLAGEFMNQYDLLSPDRYVSRAASDAQAAIDNARAQTERNLARRGVNVGSGANAALLSGLQQAREAALLAGAKTMGYDKGVTEQGNWLKDMTSAAKTFYDMGTQQQGQAIAAKNAAGDMAKGAAGIVTAQGGLLQNAGQLYSNAANIFGGAAGVEGNAAKLSMSGQNDLMNALMAAGRYYLNASQAEAGAAYGGRNWKTNFA